MSVINNKILVDDATAGIKEPIPINYASNLLVIDVKSLGACNFQLEAQVVEGGNWHILSGIAYNGFGVSNEVTVSGIYAFAVTGALYVRANVVSVSGELLVTGKTAT